MVEKLLNRQIDAEAHDGIVRWQKGARKLIEEEGAEEEGGTGGGRGREGAGGLLIPAFSSGTEEKGPEVCGMAGRGGRRGRVGG